MRDRIFTLTGKRVWIAGHKGMVGQALVRRLEKEGCHILKVARTKLDLTRQQDVEDWMAEEKPEVVFLAAAKVGGIHANRTQPANFIYDNISIGTNVLHGAWKTGVEKLLFLGSSCIYPRLAHQPMREEDLLSGPMEPSNQWYAIAKITGIKLCQAYRRQYGCDFISAQPTNLYGNGDHFNLETGHVLPSLMLKAHQAKKAKKDFLDVWGSGNARREFLHVEDLADALVHLMQNYSDEIQINVGTGQDISIRELAELICEIVGFEGYLKFDPEMPDGPPRKLLNIDRISELGWAPQINLEQGIVSAYEWYLENVAD